ncbi:MAG: hypothetical protein HY367_00770 [Candidatus Aenigmarchaeota archaeon]|nr:hypothetical protein [Candidatus Aenigmarchaeota archaeon]
MAAARRPKDLAFLAVLLLAALAVSGCARRVEPPLNVTGNGTVNGFALGPGDYDFSLVHDGLTRTYKAHVPPSYDRSTKTAVVIYIHGGGGSSAGSKNDGLYDYSDKYGFILLSPAGTGALGDRLLVWNLGPSLINGTIQTHSNYASERDIDDIGFLSKMIGDAKSRFNADGNRIYATGISQGGMMSYRLACELSDKIAAVAPVASPAVPMDCSPSRPVPVMHIHGTADPCAPFNGGSGGCLGTEKDSFQSAQEMVNVWLSIDNCLPESSVTYQKGDATCMTYSQCKEGAEVAFCAVEGMGHVWPAGNQYLPASIIGPVSHDISFEQIWEFFAEHPMG